MIETNKKRIEEEVTICLQLEDGTRLNGSYIPSSNLRTIINEMCPEKSHDNPVVIYMRSEIFAEELEKTSLKTLGVLSGRVLLRLINSDPESLKVQANVSAPLPQKPRLEEPEVEKPKQVESKQTVAFQFKNVDQLKEKKIEVEEKEKMEVDEEAVEPSKVEPSQSQQQQKEDEKKESISESQEPEIPPVINTLDDRGTIIFSLDSLQTQSMELPDSFFDLTESDVRLLYRELRREVDNNENAPLMTEQLRKLEENKKILNQLAIYKNCAVRIQLPDRHVIQTKFLTVDTIEKVMDFVKDFLIEPEMKFYLCKL